MPATTTVNTVSERSRGGGVVQLSSRPVERALDGWRALIDEFMVQRALTSFAIRNEALKRLGATEDVYLTVRSHRAAKPAGSRRRDRPSTDPPNRQ